MPCSLLDSVAWLGATVGVGVGATGFGVGVGVGVKDGADGTVGGVIGVGVGVGVTGFGVGVGDGVTLPGAEGALGALGADGALGALGAAKVCNAVAPILLNTKVKTKVT